MIGKIYYLFTNKYVLFIGNTYYLICKELYTFSFLIEKSEIILYVTIFCYKIQTKKIRIWLDLKKIEKCAEILLQIKPQKVSLGTVSLRQRIIYAQMYKYAFVYSRSIVLIGEITN